MEEQKGTNLSNYDSLTDRVITEGSDVPSVSIKTDLFHTSQLRRSFFIFKKEISYT